MSLIRVWTDVGLDKNVSLYARILRTEGTVYTIQFLSPTDEEDDHGQTIYRYEEDDTYEIDDDSITHYFHTDDETEIGFKQVSEGAWIKIDSDSDEDYVPSESEDDSTDEEEEEEEDDELTEDEDDEVDDYGDGDDEGGYYGEDD